MEGPSDDPSFEPVMRTIGVLVDVYEGTGRPAEPARWKAKVPQA